MSTADIPRQEPDTQRTGSFQAFWEELRAALPRLHDPAYRAPPTIYRALGCDVGQGSGALQAQVLAAIQGLMPAGEVPPDSRARRWYEALHMRFVLGLTQEETAERLSMSVRHLQRIQVEATHALAYALWRHDARPAPDQAPATDHEAQPPGSDWQAQTRQELEYLKASAPDAAADVGQTLEDVLRLLAPVVQAKHGTHLHVAYTQSGLVTPLHPTALRQTLITAILWLAQVTAPTELAIYALLEAGEVKVTLSAPLLAETPDEHTLPPHAILAPPEVAVETLQRAEQVFVWIRLPAVGARTVLVVEDNPDMVRFYQRCAVGTRYRVMQLPPTALTAPAPEVVRHIESLAPDAVLLDVMLPTTDGWQLLTHLHELPGTRALPVIVCSVVKEEDLALALGARLFLSKPIQPRRLVQALDQVLDRAATADAPAPGSN